MELREPRAEIHRKIGSGQATSEVSRVTGSRSTSSSWLNYRRAVALLQTFGRDALWTAQSIPMIFGPHSEVVASKKQRKPSKLLGGRSSCCASRSASLLF